MIVMYRQSRFHWFSIFFSLSLSLYLPHASHRPSLLVNPVDGIQCFLRAENVSFFWLVNTGMSMSRSSQSLSLFHPQELVQLAGGVEYTDYISAEG